MVRHTTVCLCPLFSTLKFLQTGIYVFKADREQTTELWIPHLIVESTHREVAPWYIKVIYTLLFRLSPLFGNYLDRNSCTREAPRIFEALLDQIASGLVGVILCNGAGFNHAAFFHTSFKRSLFNPIQVVERLPVPSTISPELNTTADFVRAAYLAAGKRRGLQHRSCRGSGSGGRELHISRSRSRGRIEACYGMGYSC